MSCPVLSCSFLNFPVPWCVGLLHMVRGGGKRSFDTSYVAAPVLLIATARFARFSSPLFPPPLSLLPPHRVFSRIGWSGCWGRSGVWLVGQTVRGGAGGGDVRWMGVALWSSRHGGMDGVADFAAWTSASSVLRTNRWRDRPVCCVW